MVLSETIKIADRLSLILASQLSKYPPEICHNFRACASLSLEFQLQHGDNVYSYIICLLICAPPINTAVLKLIPCPNIDICSLIWMANYRLGTIIIA
jgi:hypothetical protein